MTDQEFTHEARGRNPVLPSWLHLPDPEAHVMPDGRPYVYGSWDSRCRRTCPAAWNNHGSIEEVDGRWYVFYHCPHGNTQYGRRLCIEPITFNDDGTIDEVVMTSIGAGDPFGLDERIDEDVRIRVMTLT